MKKRRWTFGTSLADLYGKDNYSKYVEVGKCYWGFFGSESDSSISEITGNQWNKIKITYIRSGVAFYTICGFENEIEERSFYLKSIWCMQLEVAELDPYNDLPHFWTGSTECSFYRFDDERTVVYNYDNEDKEIEIPNIA